MKLMDDGFTSYVNDALKPMHEQERIHAFSNDFAKLLKEHKVTLEIVQGKMLFSFGDGWYFGIDTCDKCGDCDPDEE